MVASHLVLHARGKDESVDEALPLESVEPSYLGGVRVRVRFGLGLGSGSGLGFRVRVRVRVGVGV